VAAYNSNLKVNEKYSVLSTSARLPYRYCS